MSTYHATLIGRRHSTLIGLPNEILGIIGKNLRQDGLNSLCRASKVLYNALNPLLWKAVTIRAKDEWKLADLDVGIVLRPYNYYPPQDHIQHVKSVTITAPIHQRIHYRCEHGPTRFDRIMQGLEPDVPNLVDKLAVSLAPFFQHLGDGQLRKFSWDLGICLLCEVAPLFGPCGYIPLKQPSIESLFLITGDPCTWKNPQKKLLGLHLLKKLKHLSWKGLRATKYLNDLQGVFECNADHLKSIELDVIDWDKTNNRWDRERRRKSIFQLQPSIHRVLFSELTDLSLSNISFQGAASELACAFNGSMLRGLRLHNCRDYPSFLSALVDLASGIRLKLFHLSIDDRDPEVGKHAVRRFLEAFEGLEELGLLIQPGATTLFSWISATHHKATLKRFIFHERMEPGRENRFLDMYSVIEHTASIGYIPGIGFGEYSAELSLECLAVCGDVGNWKPRLQFLGSQCGIKLMHLRISGADKYRKEDNEEDAESTPSSNSTPPPQPPSARLPFAKRHQMSLGPHRAQQLPGLIDLASWAFSPDDLLNLQVLAYGDFSYRGRYIEDTVVFGRNRPGESSRGFPGSSSGSGFGYSLLDKDERSDVMALYGDFLEACPVDSLVRLDRLEME